ncbi:unnamed protein product [Eruca vesicaria subsp. sativa]|uniref:Peptidase A1 domain-containing protein n=1 Tax=Eruca vesicaria subsp. sativa TaxID=29727 RepID=A0ABC8LSB9_ERUVS|nr:unnamed protein product [Eruca vesicaria subsp. sativa]
MGGYTRLLVVLSMLAAVALTSKAQYVISINKDEATKQFYTSFYIGDDGMETRVNLLLDLGTNLTWANCRRLESLSSLHLVRCQSPTCKAIPGNGCDSRNICLYQQPNPLGKNSSVTGRVVQDTASFTASSFRPFTFSCAAVKTPQGLPPPVAGILGLSTGEYSFWRQVTKKFNIIPQFTLCLPSSGTTGNFYIGGISYSVPRTPTSMRVSSGEYFFVVNSIYVDGTPLSLNPGLLNGGAKLSTVVPYTVLHTDIYNALAQSFTLKAKAMGISQVRSVAPFKNCFDARAAAGNNIPVIEIGVPGKIREERWTFHGTNTVVNINKKVICLAFIDAGKKPKENIVVGTYQLQNYIVTFDMSRTELTFSDSLLLHNTSCSS